MNFVVFVKQNVQTDNFEWFIGCVCMFLRWADLPIINSKPDMPRNDSLVGSHYEHIM